MSYSNPLHRITFALGIIDFGSAPSNIALAVPKGMTAARIDEVSVSATETFNAVTTSGKLRIGTAGDADKFVELDCGTTAAGSSVGTKDDTDAIKAAGQSIDLTSDGDSGAAVSELIVDFVAPVGGTPAGQGHVFVEVAFWG